MVSLTSDWQSLAICLNSEDPSLWISSDIKKIREAANICGRCPVKVECLYNAVYEDEFIGVCGGITEYEYLSNTWVRVDDVEESNWPRTDSIIQRLFRQYA